MWLLDTLKKLVYCLKRSNLRRPAETSTEMVVTFTSFWYEWKLSDFRVIIVLATILSLSAWNLSAVLPVVQRRISWIWCRGRGRASGIRRLAGTTLQRYRSLLSLCRSTTVASGSRSKVAGDARLSSGLFWRLVNGRRRRMRSWNTTLALRPPRCTAQHSAPAGRLDINEALSSRWSIGSRSAADRQPSGSTAKPPPPWTQFSARVTWTDPEPNGRRRGDATLDRWRVRRAGRRPRRWRPASPFIGDRQRVSVLQRVILPGRSLLAVALACL